MKMKNTMLVVRDIKKSETFYWEILGLRTLVDLDIHAVLTGGLALQTEDSWKGFIAKDVTYTSNNTEIYFEEDNFDEFIAKLNAIKTVEYVHPVMEHSWGQRVVRFYDPDYHIIEVGENMKNVCKRYLDMGMTLEEIAVKMELPLKAVKSYAR